MQGYIITGNKNNEINERKLVNKLLNKNYVLCVKTKLHALYYSHNKLSAKLLSERLVLVRRCDVDFVTEVDIHKYCVD